MWRNRLVNAIAALFISAPVLAQQGTITGRVTSAEDGQPLARVVITISGQSVGTLTRDDGRFSLKAQPGTYTLRAARLGYSPDSVVGVEVAAGGTASANFQLHSSATLLTGLVVVGYGTEQRRNTTGSIARVDTAQFNTGRVVSPEQLISGKVAGVQVVDNNEPGGGISIRVRGGSSVTSSNEPLYVVDGVPLQIGGGVSDGRDALGFLDPNDIESITVLKDASATAIYGSRGANGVVMITTKSGRSGLNTTYTTSFSTSTITGRPDMLSADQFRSAVQQYAPYNMNQLGSANTNWIDQISRNGTGQQHDLAFSGRHDAMNYRLSLGYLNQQGVLQGTALQRLSTNFNYSDLLLHDRLNVDASIKGSRTQNWYTPGGVLFDATQFAPTQAVRNPDGTWYQYSDYLSPNNPLAELAMDSDRGNTLRGIGNIQAKYKSPGIDGLTTTMNMGYDVSQATRSSFYPSNDYGQVKQSLGGTLSESNPSQANSLFEWYGDYSRPLDFMGRSDNFDLTAGYTYEQENGNYPNWYAQGLASNLLGLYGVPAAKIQHNYLTVDESKLASFFGRVNYSIKDRYLLTLSVRRDGSSRFGPEHQWGVFPAAAFAWRLSDEPFLSQFKTLSDLKLRLSYGVNGNQAFGNYLQYSSYTIGNSTSQVQMGNQFVTTIRPSAVDPGIRWEQTASNDAGLDYGFYNNRITGSLDYYYKKTTNLIFNVPVAAGTNLSNYVTTNIGSLENRGLELTLNARVIDGGRRGFSWDANFNASTNANKLLKITAASSGGQQILTGGIYGGVGNNIEVLMPGQPVNSFFVYQHRVVNGQPVTGDKPDTALYVDINRDSVINQSDRRPFHDPAPKWILGHTSMFTYGAADLSFTLRAYLGNYVYNNVASNLGNYTAVKGAAPVNLQASVLKYQFVNPQYFSDLYVENASFLRMDNITAGYRISVPRVQSFRIFGTIQNVFTTTKYSGVDPTAGVNGIDNNIYPRSRTYLAGANFAF